MSLLVNVVNPSFLLDIPSSYMLKNILHASASRSRYFACLPAFLFIWSSLSVWCVIFGMLLTTIASAFVFAAFQRLTALVGQEALMSGLLSAQSNIFLFLPVAAAYSRPDS